jgi:phosphoglycolate phosphatase-like HAD superfamily hydrolase
MGSWSHGHEPPFEAVLFDLDGVLTSTAALHARCWKTVVDELVIKPFDIERDYLAHVDAEPPGGGRARGTRRAPARRLSHGSPMRLPTPGGL